MKAAANIVLKLLGTVLMVAAALKAWQLLTQPMPENGLWTSRPVLIAQVELELLLGIWLISGLFKKAAWTIVLACFALFSAITVIVTKRAQPKSGICT